MTSRFASLNEQEIEKIVEDKESQNTKRSTKVAKELFADYVKQKKLREPEELKFLCTNFAKVLCRSKKEFVQCKIKQLLDSVFVLSRIIKVSVRVISLSLRLRLITLTCTSTLIILDITKTSSIACENRRLARRNVYDSETENPY